VADIECTLQKSAPTVDAQYVAITRDLRRLLKSEIRRTGLQPRFILKGRPDIPAGLDARTINSWIRGTVRDARSAHVAYVIRILADAPSVQELSGAAIHPAKTGPRPVANGSTRCAVTAEMRDTLVQEIKRTGATAIDLARMCSGSDSGLTVGMIGGLSSGKIATVVLPHWEALLAHLASLPDEAAIAVRPRSVGVTPRAKGYHPISADEFAALQLERKRTGLSGVELFRRAVDAPEHLNGKMISAWLHQQTRSALPDHIAYALALYRAQPDE
jgi:hypothetical protein